MKSRIKNAFIPHKGNKYRPDILERFSMGVMLVLILLSFAIANLQSLLWISSDWLVSTILPSVIVDLTNDERDSDDLAPLTRSAFLDDAARRKAEDMAKNSYFAHYSPTGVSPWYWFEAVGYDYLHAGENLAVHFTESDAVVQAWMDSPTHRENILNGTYSEIGVGSARGVYNGNETIFVVQLFGTQRSPVPSTSEVAGVQTESENKTITVEKVSLADESPDVAPATIVTEALQPTPQMPVTSEGNTSPEESLMEISRPGEPAVAPVPVIVAKNQTSLPLRSTTDSSSWLETFYAILALFVVGSLVTSLAYEWRKHRFVQSAYAGGLLAVMAMLLYIHTSLTGFVLIA